MPKNTQSGVLADSPNIRTTKVTINPARVEHKMTDFVTHIFLRKQFGIQL